MHSITLKRALKLRKDIEAHISQTIPNTLTYNLISSNQDEIDTARANLLAKKNEMIELSSILSHLRLQIARQNTSTEIEQTLAEIGHLERSNKILTAILTTSNGRREILQKAPTITDGESDETIQKTIAFYKAKINEPSDQFGSHPTTELKINILLPVSAKAYQDTIKENKQKIADLEDKRLSLNINTQIQFSDESYNLLRKVGLL